MRHTTSALICLLLSLPTSVAAFECGDLDASGSVGASDALHVLRRAVGLPANLECPAVSCTTTTSTTSSTFDGGVGDQCFTNADCFGSYPGQPFCCGFECCECIENTHCPEGQVCGGDRCVIPEF